jgi:iron complex transport system substrate-binding protein
MFPGMVTFSLGSPRRARRGLVVLPVMVAGLLAGCGGQDAERSPAQAASRAEVVKSCGKQLSVMEPPRRAIGLEQNATEILLSLQLAERMVGSSYQTDPPLPGLQAAYDSVPVLAKLYPSRERVLEAEPDFVYSTYASAFADDAAGSRAALAKLDIPAYLSANGCEDPQLLPKTVTFGQVFAEIRDIARIFGVRARGEALVADQERRLRAARETAGEAGAGETLLWYYSGTATPYVSGCCGMPATLTQLVGAENAFGDEPEKWFEGNWEAIADRDPSVIVLADLTRGGDGDSAASKRGFLRTHPVAKQMRAVRENRFVVVAGSETDPNVRSVLAAEKLAAGLTRLDGGS